MSKTPFGFKGNFSQDGLLEFGTIHLLGEKEFVTDPGWQFADAKAEIASHLPSRPATLWKPETVATEFKAYTNRAKTAVFIKVEFRLEHGLRAMRLSQYAVRREVAYLLSGFLQTGEGVTLQNLRRYQRRDSLNFLPFLIDETHFHFFVHRASEERTATAAKAFLRVLDKIQQMPIGKMLTEINALLFLERGVLSDADASMIVGEKVAEFHKAVTTPMKPYAGCLGFVYQDLPGSQSATQFSYDM